MTTAPLIDCQIHLDGWDITADVTSAKPAVKRERLDKTTFGSKGWKEWACGLGSGELAVSTFLDPALIDAALRPIEHTGGHLLTVTADDQHGSFAFFGSGLLGDLDRGGDVGQMSKLDFPVQMEGRQGVLAGKLLVPKSTKTTTGTGTPFQLGAASATQRVWAAAHCFSVAGTGTPKLTLKLQSAAAQAFSSPTDRVTFTDFTATGAQLLSVAGGVTDTWWRFSWTVSGTGPQVSIAALAAIQ